MINTRHRIRALLKTEGYSRDKMQDDLASVLHEDPIVNVPEFQGIFAMSARSDLFKRIVRDKHYEPTITAELLKNLDRTKDFVDVGANIGFHSVLVAKHLLTGRVISIEPTQAALKRLKRNVLINDVVNKVTIKGMALGTTIGVMKIQVVQGKEEYSSLAGMHHPSIARQTLVTEDVPVSTLDAVVESENLNVGLVKIDVEGFEKMVIEGGINTLRHQRPVLITELSSYLNKKNHQASSDVVALVVNLGYRVLNLTNPAIAAGDSEFGDIICLPI